MNRYVLISADEYVALQAYRQRVELERVQRVLKYWSEHVTKRAKVKVRQNRRSGHSS